MIRTGIRQAQSYHMLQHQQSRRLCQDRLWRSALLAGKLLTEMYHQALTSIFIETVDVLGKKICLLYTSPSPRDS